MAYNWEHKNWPNFEYDDQKTQKLDLRFYELLGILSGINLVQNQNMKIESLVDQLVLEATKTSEIEGEYLSKIDLVSSIKKNLGYPTPSILIKDKRAAGIAELMVLIKESYHEPLSNDMLKKWHTYLMKGSYGISVGHWRSQDTPMQIISGSIGREKVHFVAPASNTLNIEMERFVNWYNSSLIIIKSPLIFSSICHLFFESIHPFEDGNGRIGRALAEKALHHHANKSFLISLSAVIAKNKNLYYTELKKAQTGLEISDWVIYFSHSILAAMELVIEKLKFITKKDEYFKKHIFNLRQNKVLAKMLEEEDFIGGMNVKKYISITGSSKATATRDLQDLVRNGAMSIIGIGKSTSYYVNFENH